MNIIEIGDKVLWPFRSACGLCLTVVDLNPADINRAHAQPWQPGWWKCPKCGAAVLVSPLLATSADFETERIVSAVNQGKREYSDGPALEPVHVELGEQ